MRPTHPSTHAANDQTSTPRACCNLRVSKDRQAETDRSIPDQKLKVAAFCGAKGWPLMAKFVELGASAMGDQRTELQLMIELAAGEDRSFDCQSARQRDLRPACKAHCMPNNSFLEVTEKATSRSGAIPIKHPG